MDTQPYIVNPQGIPNNLKLKIRQLSKLIEILVEKQKNFFSVTKKISKNRILECFKVSKIPKNCENDYSSRKNSWKAFLEHP